MSMNISTNEYARKLADAARTPSQHKVDPKVYFHHFNYAKFHFDLGGSAVKSVSFANHRYITDDKREQDQLDMVADVPGTFIYTLPESEVDAAIQRELQQELANSVMQTARAHAAVHGQQFDPNTPIMPVQVQHVQPTPVQVAPASGGRAVVGMQSSMSGTTAVDPIAANLTQAAEQMKAPSSADEAAARIAALTQTAKQK
jgi:hypothetical protein